MTGEKEGADVIDLTFFAPGTEKRSSGIHGRGLFTTRRFERGEIVVVKGGHVMTRSQRDAVYAELGPTEIQIADDLYIGPVTAEERESSTMYLNHSCDPNLGIDRQIIFAALLNIEAGEELFFDYGTGDDDEWEMECTCGAAECRVTITGRDWRPPELQRKRRGYFSQYIEQKIAALDGAAADD